MWGLLCLVVLVALVLAAKAVPLVVEELSQVELFGVVPVASMEAVVWLVPLAEVLVVSLAFVVLVLSLVVLSLVVT